jgi:hypothetical protein
MIAVTTLEQVSVRCEPVGSWLLVGLVSLLLAAVLLALPPDRTRVSGGRRLTLVILRLLAFLALVACLLRPTIVASQKARQPATVIVLADASKSMTVADGPDGRTRWEEMRAALESARPSVRRLIAGGDFELAGWLFDGDLRPLDDAGAAAPLELGAWADAASTAETGIGAAVDDALRAAAGRTVAGMLLLSDGAQQAYAPRDLPPQVAARRLGEVGVPLWTVTFGQQRGGGQGRDAAIVNLSVADTVYVKNSLEVAGRVRLEGLAGVDAQVRLFVENEAGELEPVAATRVRSMGESTEEPVRLEWTPDSLGERKVVLRVEPQDGEVVLANNELSTFVDVIDGGLRVLYLEGGLRVEQRFLRRVLAANPDLQLDFQWIDSSQRGAWPVDLSRLVTGDYDVFLIGDLDSAALRPEDLRTMLGKVGAGAGIGLLGGFHAFEAGGWAGSALGPLMPFEADPLARQPFDEPIRARLHLPGPVRMLPDPRFGGVSILRLARDGEDPRAVWESLPTLDGANDLGRLLPTAKPLAMTADGRPLLVAREYGAGRVLAFAADTTWRWVMQGAGDRHRRFWRQLVLWLAKRDESDADRLWLRLAQRRLAPGVPLEFDAGITSAEGALVPDLRIEASVIPPDGQRRPVRVLRQAESFSGAVTDCDEPGDWTLLIRGSRGGTAEVVERAKRFTVFRQDLELANPRSNPALMRQLAEATDGGVRMPEELAGVFDEIAERPPEFEVQEQWSYSPWDSWPMLMAVAACLCGEWFLRKRWGLV